MSRRPVIAVVGAGRDIEPAVSHARELGRLIAEKGWVMISGGRDIGVMKAANEGAKEVGGSLRVGILPTSDATPSDAVDVVIVTDTGQARNNIIVLSADVVIACGVDGAGTASEVGLALKNGKPVILVNASEEANRFFKRIDDANVLLAESPGDAIKMADSLIDPK